jgi:hypothetical protein
VIRKQVILVAQACVSFAIREGVIVQNSGFVFSSFEGRINAYL